MNISKILEQQKPVEDPLDKDQRVVQANNEILRLETDLQRKKQALYQLKARISQEQARSHGNQTTAQAQNQNVQNRA